MAWNGEKRTTPERRGLLRFRSRSSLVGAAMILTGLAGMFAVALYLGSGSQIASRGSLAATPSTPAPTIAPPNARQVETPKQPTADIQGVVSGEYSPKRVFINGHEFSLELARDASERSIGLSGRESLGADAGMLFVFPNEGFHRFWMKGTLVPLDLIYIDAGGTIVSIQTMQPEPGVSDPNLTIYRPPVNVWLAMEVNGNRANETGLKEGMTVRFE